MKSSKQPWLTHQLASAMSPSLDIPMWGCLPPFPWEKFTSHLRTLFHIDDLDLRAKKMEWLKGNDILKGMGDRPLHASIALSPIQGSISLIFPAKDFALFSSWAINSKANHPHFSDPQLQQGFFYYLALKTLAAIDSLNTLPSLSPKLIDLPLTEEDAYCIDLELKKGQNAVWTRLICPTTIQKSLQSFYSQDFQFSFSSPLYSSLDLDLSLCLGSTLIQQRVLQKIKKGDFILLDHASYSPYTKKGTFQLVFEQRPLFQVKLKEEQIKILDYAVYYEENKMHDEHEDEDVLHEETFDAESDISEDIEEEQEIKQESDQDMFSPKEIVIQLTVEVAKLKMNLDKLLQLKPGNVLNLSVKPEQGVSLIAGDKRIAFGELVQVGDVLGVKITKIGHSS